MDNNEPSDSDIRKAERAVEERLMEILSVVQFTFTAGNVLAPEYKSLLPGLIRLTIMMADLGFERALDRHKSDAEAIETIKGIRDCDCDSCKVYDRIKALMAEIDGTRVTKTACADAEFEKFMKGLGL